MTVLTSNGMHVEIEMGQVWRCHDLQDVTVTDERPFGHGWLCSDGKTRDNTGRTAEEGFQAGDFMTFIGGSLEATFKKIMEFVPINPATGEPYFKIPAAGWGTGWKAGKTTHIHIDETRLVPGTVTFNGRPVPDEAVNFDTGEIDLTKFEEGRKHLAQQMAGFIKGSILNADDSLFGSCTGTDSRVEVPGYELLADVLDRAYDQAARGKGHERHSNGEPFDEQVMQDMARRFGVGSLLGQAFKKSEESQRLPHDRAIRELLGSINYLAGAVIFLEAREADKETEF